MRCASARAYRRSHLRERSAAPRRRAAICRRRASAEKDSVAGGRSPATSASFTTLALGAGEVVERTQR